MNKTNKVACFYTQLKDNKGTIEFTNDSFPLIEYWEKSWKANGWETYVLGEDDIIKDEYYSNLKFDNFKESNLCKYTVDWDCEYSRACYLRWLAYYQFAKKHGDIFWADYDVINYGLSPHLRVKVNTALSGCNSAGKLNKDGGRKILDAFVSVEKEKYQINTLHESQKVSDMFIARAFDVFDVHQANSTFVFITVSIQAALAFLATTPAKFRRMGNRRSHNASRAAGIIARVGVVVLKSPTSNRGNKSSATSLTMESETNIRLPPLSNRLKRRRTSQRRRCRLCRP